MSQAALERQIRPIYEALDSGSTKAALVACNKVLKKYPKNELVKALKSLALVRSQKVEESLVLCDEILESKPTNDATLSAMTLVLKGLGRYNDTITMFEDAWKQQPGNEDFGAQTFIANTRTANWKAAQQIATRLYKAFQEDRYLYWNVISAILQANDPETPPNMKTILYKLAHRLIESCPTPSYINTDRFYLHLSIVRELKLWDEAKKLLDSDVGKAICATSLSVNEIRREIWKEQGLHKEESQRAKELILEKNDRNWLEFLAVLDAAFAPITTAEGEVSDERKAEVSANVDAARSLFTQVAELDGLKDRSGLLGLVELERRSRQHGVSEDPSKLVALMSKYFNTFGDKSCCFEDLKPFLSLEGEELERWSSFLKTVSLNVDTVDNLQRTINVHKFIRYNLSGDQLTVEGEQERLKVYIEHYEHALPLGANLPSTERQPADDLALLAGNTYVNLWTISGDESHLQAGAAFLEYALTKSKQLFFARLILIRIYRLLGAPSLALEHYRAMGIKQVQNDTLSHLHLSRASTFSLAPTGDLTYISECLDATSIYLSNSQETSDFIIRAFNSEKYSQIPEFITFEERLENSLQRDCIKIEYLRMRLSHEQLLSDLIDMELIELKFVFDRLHYDNRDFEIFPDYQPKASKSLHEQTVLFDKVEGMGWLSIFLKTYIRAFQHASDMDDTVEDKLLIGDRPKQTAVFDKSLTYRERLKQRTEEEYAELTEEERKFVDFTSALADWIEPYHDYARPPPEVVLAEAAKQTELKTGHPLKGFQLPANGTNGSHKKDEEPPAVTEPPALLAQHFEDAKARFAALKGSGSVVDILHLAALVQEAFLFVTVETLRFKSASVIKINKFGGLVPHIKAIRAAGVSALKEISASVLEIAETVGSADSRKAVTQACGAVPSSKIDHDFAFVSAKKIVESRKKVLEGVSKGLAKVATNYAS